MKNPNGYGCIKLLSGSRRRPYCFVVSQQGKQKVIGYFVTKLEAMAYQVDYNQSHGLHRLSDNKITFAELYARWLPKHIEYSSVSDSTIHGYESSYKHCVYLYDVPVAEIKYSHLQTVIDGMGSLSYASKKKVRNLLSLLWAYARQMDYTSNDYRPATYREEPPCEPTSRYQPPQSQRPMEDDRRSRHRYHPHTDLHWPEKRRAPCPAEIRCKPSAEIHPHTEIKNRGRRAYHTYP
nr:MAG TPA: Integrase [Caudoviricetes sp.]